MAATDARGAFQCGTRDLVRWGYVGIWLALAGAYAIADGHNLAQSIIYVVTNLAAVVAMLMGIRLNRPARPDVWYWLVAGQAIYLVANVGWYVVPFVSDRSLAFPSATAPLFVASYVVTAVAFLRLVRIRRAGADLSALLDSLVVTSTFSSVNYVLVIAPMLATSELSWRGVLYAGAYPFMDTVLLLLVCRLMFGAGRVNGALALLAAWAGALLVADTSYGMAEITRPVRPGYWPFYVYLASYLFIGAAALHPGMRDIARSREPAGTTGRMRLLMLGLCGLIVPALAINSVRNGGRIVPIVLCSASAFMFLLLMVRVAHLLAATTAAARREHGRLQQFLEAVPVGVAVHNVDTGEPAYVNHTAMNLLGYDPGTLSSPVEMPNLYICGTDEPYPPNRLPAARALRGEAASVDDVEVALDTSRVRRRLRVVGTPIRDGDRLQYALSTFADITAERQMAEELRRQSLNDDLTGVNNRRGFLLAARARLARVQQEHRTAALLFVDLDGLKAINDAHGHGVGDHAIRGTARILKASIRRSDVLGRVGGDEFCALLSDVGSSADIDLWVRRLHAQVTLHNGASNQPYQLAFTVGVTVFDPAAPKSIEELMHLADEAMYSARNARRGAATTTDGGDAG